MQRATTKIRAEGRGGRGLILTVAAGSILGIAQVRGQGSDPGSAFPAAAAAYEAQPQNATNSWKFARACFDMADGATNNADRAVAADRGISAARKAIADAPDCAPAYYYLGLNLGQSARTKSLGALKLVSQMERALIRAGELDPQFDFAGPDRSLGLLYRDAPSIISVGSRNKARQHLQRAVELAPDYPENRLNLIESEIKWNERKAARRDLMALEAGWDTAKRKFAGPRWASSWQDWQARLESAQRVLGESPKPLEAPRHG